MSFGQDKTVKVSLKADVSSYIGKITAAQKATRDFGKEALEGATKNTAAWEKTGKVMAGTGVALAAGVGLAVKAFADFDKEMSTVRAVSGATAGEMDKLRAAALKAGADTSFSASEAAKAQSELAKVGLSTADILGGALIGSMSLAAAGTLDLGRAAEISGQAMKVFKLEGKDVGRIADALASGANKSAAGVEDLAQALSQGGLVAAQTGLNLEDTIGTLSAFADNALMGSDAGTSLKTMLSRLNPTTEDAAQAMEALGLSAYDTRGNFVGIDKFAGQLKAGLKNLTVEQRNSRLQTVFGADAIRAATILYDLGEQGVRKYIDGVKDQGAAARVAGIQMDNLAGDLEALKGSFETALIQSGSTANDSLRSLTQTATEAVNWFGELPEPVQEGAIKVAALGAATLITGGAFVALVPKLAATQAALWGTEAAAARTALALRTVGIAGAAIGLTLGVDAITKKVNELSQATIPLDDMATSLDALGRTGKLGAEGLELFSVGIGPLRRGADDSTEALDTFAESAGEAFGSGTIDAINRFVQAGAPLDKFAGKAKVIDEALGQLVSSGRADSAAAAFKKFSDIIRAQGGDLKDVAAMFPTYTATLTGAGEAVGNLAGTTDLATSKTQEFADTQSELKKRADDARTALDTLLNSIEGFGSGVLDARGAARDYEAAIDAASQSIKDNGKTMDKHTAKGRANQQSLEAIATTTLKSITANYQHGASVKTLDKQVTDSRKAFIGVATDMGLSDKAAGKLADSLGLTRTNVAKLNDAKAVPKVEADTSQALLSLNEVRHNIEGLDGATAIVNVVTSFSKGLEGYAGKAADNVLHPASGGYITGAGTATSDSIPAMLSNKEYVVNAAAVSKYGVGFFHELNRMRFATGGYVGSSSPGTSTRNTTYDQPVNISHATFTDGADLRKQAERERRQAALRQT